MTFAPWTAVVSRCLTLAAALRRAPRAHAWIVACLIGVAALVYAKYAMAATFTVTSTADTSGSGTGACGGTCTLRQAIIASNATSGGPHTINFNIPGCPSTCTISPASALPTITRAVTINGTSQPGWASAPIIEINGSGAGSSVSGLSLNSVSGATIRGLVIRNFNGSGIAFDTVANSTVAGNYLGLNAAGTAAAANGAQGINLWNSTTNTIGGTTAADRNVISGNAGNGIVITASSGGSGNVVRGNYVGTNAAGTGAVANGSLGVDLGSSGNTVGGTAAGAGNVISGNTYTGLVVESGANSTTVQGNYIGTNAAGTAAVANGDNGIYVSSSGNTLGGTASGAGNVVSGNSAQGLWIESNSNVIQGNIIGLNAAGNAKLRNAQNGIVLSAADSNTIGGSAAGARNVISGHDSVANTWDAIFLYNGSDSNTIKGNYLGTDSTGTVAFGNSYSGVTIYGGINNVVGGTAVGEGNLIANNRQGVEVTYNTGASEGNSISGNSIYANTVGGILLEASLPANDGTTTASKGNLLMDSPVISAASYSGTTLSLAGYVGSAAGQAAFANATVQVFASSTTGGNGQGP